MDIGEYGQPGSNGLALDREGRLTINEHGNHRVSRLEKTGALTVLADRFDGKRLNSPNDLVYDRTARCISRIHHLGCRSSPTMRARSCHSAACSASLERSSSWSAKELSGPNGLAFSPDEKYLYVGNWDEKKKVVMRYDVNTDGSLSNGKVFFDMTSAPGEDAHRRREGRSSVGNVYVSGPGGLWILSPGGKHLGTIVTPEHAHNFAWGDDGRSLYVTARSTLYRIRLKVAGSGVAAPATN